MVGLLLVSLGMRMQITDEAWSWLTGWSVVHYIVIRFAARKYLNPWCEVGKQRQLQSKYTGCDQNQNCTRRRLTATAHGGLGVHQYIVAPGNWSRDVFPCKLQIISDHPPDCRSDKYHFVIFSLSHSCLQVQVHVPTFLSSWSCALIIRETGPFIKQSSRLLRFGKRNSACWMFGYQVGTCIQHFAGGWLTPHKTTLIVSYVAPPKSC
jgi:hypothetical protein